MRKFTTIHCRMEQLVLVFGEPLKKMPKNLYIPPEALRVMLSVFEGPLDLLLYLIRRHNIAIHDIPVALITEQYLAYIRAMRDMDMTLAAEYLLMAATLADIKARMLLPQPEVAEGEEEHDPRAELADRLLRYAQTADAARMLANMARVDAGLALSAHTPPAAIVPRLKPDADVEHLAQTIRRLWHQHGLKRAHQVEKESYSLAERIERIEAQLAAQHGWQEFSACYQPEEGRGGLVVSLMALLEMDRAARIEWRQAQAFAPVYLRAREA